jgi:hypothetical protein
MKSQATPAQLEGLRAQLMARDPMQRVIALHAIEVEAVRGAAARLAGQVEAFAARGIPYYSPQDPHYQAWVDRALELWQRVHDEPGMATAG